MTLRCFRAGWLLVFLMIVPPPAQAAIDPQRAGVFAALRNADARLATIGYRLATANAALCDQTQPAFGLTLQAITQYDLATRDDARAAFGFAAVVAIEAVVPGSPADQAGLRAGDSLLAIDGEPQPPLTQAKAAVTSLDRDAAQAAIVRGGVDRPLVLRVLRDGRSFAVTVMPRPACRSEFEVLLGSGLEARSDGARVQIGGGYFDQFGADEIAVVVAHELAHNILHHYRRLHPRAACGIRRNLTRQTEDEADRMSVYLLANAGYDPDLPARFWRWYGARLQGNALFGDGTHASATARAKTLEAVAAAIGPVRDLPIRPADLAQLRGQGDFPDCPAKSVIR